MATYKVPLPHFIVRRQANNTVNFNDPYGDPSGDPPPPVPDPPVLVSQIPNLSPQVNVAFSYDTSVHFSGSTALTYSSLELPASGLSLNSTTGVISGTPTSAVTFDVTITATDEDAQSVSDTFTMTIREEPVTVTDKPWNWPNVRACFPTSGSNQAIYKSQASATQKLWLYRSCATVVQFRGFESAAVRRNTRNETLHIVERGLPGTPIIVHMNLLVIQALRQPSGRLEWYPTYDYVRKNRDDGIAKNNSHPYLGRRTSASAPDRYLESSFSDGLVERVAGDWLDALHHPGDDDDLGDIYKGWLNDGFRVPATKKCEERHGGTISAIGGTGNREITIPYWAAMPLDGNPDGGGFEGLTQTLWPWFYTTNDMAADRAIKRAKHNGTSSTTILLTNNLDSAVSTGWTCQIMTDKGETTRVDWNRDNQDESYSSSNQGPGTEAYQRAQLWMNWLDKLNDKVSEKHVIRGEGPKDYGRCYNAIGATYLRKFGQGMTPTHALSETADIVHSEHTETGRSSVSEFKYKSGNKYQYGLTNIRDLEFYVGKFPFALSFLRRNEPLNDLNVRGIIGSVNVGHGEVDGHTQVSVAYASFWETMIIMAGGGEWFPNILHSSMHRWQAPSGLMLVSLGGGPIVPTSWQQGSMVNDQTSNFGTSYSSNWGLHDAYDPEGNSNKGTVALRTPNWGGFAPGQWEMWFPGDGTNFIVVVMNMRLVPQRNDDWIPHDQPGGQSIDVDKDTYVIHDIPKTKKLYSLDLSDYVNPETGDKMGEGIFGSIDGEAVNVAWEDAKYPSVQNGRPGIGELLGGNGDTITLGPGEVRWMIIADE